MEATTTRQTFVPQKPFLPKPTSEEKCRKRLLEKLQELKNTKILNKCFDIDSNEFEVLEFYGDACLYEQISHFIMRTRRFMDPHLMTKLRTCCIRNATLSNVYEELRLSDLFGDDKPVTFPSAPKERADVVEAIIGELAENDRDSAILGELFNYIAYLGEKEFILQELPSTDGDASPAKRTNGKSRNARGRGGSNAVSQRKRSNDDNKMKKAPEEILMRDPVLLKATGPMFFGANSQKLFSQSQQAPTYSSTTYSTSAPSIAKPSPAYPFSNDPQQLIPQRIRSVKEHRVC